MKTTTFIITFLLFILLTSCGYSNYPRTGSSTYHNTNPEEILIYQKDIEQDYEIIGPVGTEVTGDKNLVVKHLKKKASKQGADAIIHAKVNYGNSAKRAGISGIAVKLIKNTDAEYSLANR